MPRDKFLFSLKMAASLAHIGFSVISCEIYELVLYKPIILFLPGYSPFLLKLPQVTYFKDNLYFSAPAHWDVPFYPLCSKLKEEQTRA